MAVNKSGQKVVGKGEGPRVTHALRMYYVPNARGGLSLRTRMVPIEEKR